jgi:hypothetical protein
MFYLITKTKTLHILKKKKLLLLNVILFPTSSLFITNRFTCIHVAAYVHHQIQQRAATAPFTLIAVKENIQLQDLSKEFPVPTRWETG